MGRTDDLISRAALLNDLSYCAPELWQDEAYIQVKIMKQPAVDAVPVVRCKDCKHSIDYDFSEGQGFCDLTGLIVRENFYCAEGKKNE